MDARARGIGELSKVERIEDKLDNPPKPVMIYDDLPKDSPLVPGASETNRAASKEAISRMAINASQKRDTKISPQRQDTGISRPWPVPARGDEVLMDETAPYRGISSATRFRMR